MQQDHSLALQQSILDAYQHATPLHIQGSGSKAFYGRTFEGQRLTTTSHCGIVNYEPTELILTARAGTSLTEIETTLNQNGQMLGFEPPSFGSHATLGGTIAGNFSGPRRAFTGAARDFVLGSKIINGKGEILRFGGEVMKNVAGYDVSRLMVGALGTLGVLLDISLKVLPSPEMETTRSISCTSNEAMEKLQKWARLPLPISATCLHDSQLYVRFSGVEKAVIAAANITGGDIPNNAHSFWIDLKEQRMDFFSTNKTLWRLSLAPDLPPLDQTGQWLYEWNGALRWYKGDHLSADIRTILQEHNGHATVFRRSLEHDTDANDIFHPLTDAMLKLHMRLKKAFDPRGILNPGILHPNL